MHTKDKTELITLDTLLYLAYKIYVRTYPEFFHRGKSPWKLSQEMVSTRSISSAR
ncbi:MAG: hypothetical protein JWN49_356 [Parcubacteria group bacterium]|nr:hypothetical protein [Parcubacteria group bacterium]